MQSIFYFQNKLNGSLKIAENQNIDIRNNWQVVTLLLRKIVLTNLILCDGLQM